MKNRPKLVQYGPVTDRIMVRLDADTVHRLRQSNPEIKLATLCTAILRREARSAGKQKRRTA